MNKRIAKKKKKMEDSTNEDICPFCSHEVYRQHHEEISETNLFCTHCGLYERWENIDLIIIIGRIVFVFRNNRSLSENISRLKSAIRRYKRYPKLLKINDYENILKRARITLQLLGEDKHKKGLSFLMSERLIRDGISTPMKSNNFIIVPDRHNKY